MGRHRCLLVATLFLTTACLGRVGPAFASPTLALPVPGTIVLGFGDRYAEGDRQRTHSGLDIGAVAGETVVAAAAGRVTFAGAVPADGGGRAYAVTVETADLSRVTLSPLESVSVSAGESVVAGDEVGTLAALGDSSTVASHVHLSVRVGDIYVDPEPLLTPAVASAGSGGPTTSGAVEVPQAPVDESGAGARSTADASAGTVAVPGVTVGGARGAQASSTREVQGSGSTAPASAAVETRSSAALQARVGSAYCAAITSLRTTRATTATRFASTAAEETDSGSPVVPAIPVAGTLAAAALLGVGAMAGHRRESVREAA
ncbi:MAG: murein hydrolase activator EnvC family protein [Coriobacteriia bacterium]